MPFAASSTIGLTLQGWVIALAVALVALAVFAYWRTTPSVDGRARGVLVTLRAAALVLLVLLLLDPRSIWHGDRDEPARVVLLVDRSASMSLPARGWSGGETRFDAARQAADELAAAITARGGTPEVVTFAGGAEFDGDVAADSLRPDGQGSDIVRALGDAARHFEGEHVAAAIVIGDGVETDASLVRPALPALTVWTIGVGDTVAPNDVRIAGVDYSPVVRAPSRATVSATVGSTGPAPKRVRVELAEDGRVVFARDTTLAAGSGEATLRIPVRVEEPGRREFVLSVSTDGEDYERDNNRRDVVIEVEKARTRILIVDLTPSWELSFLTTLLARDPAYDCEVIVSARRPASATGRLKRPEEFIGALVDADAVVLASLSEEFMTAEVTGAIRRFVTERGGGLLVLPGSGSLFETAAAWGRLADLLPVRGSAPFTFTLQYTSVGPGAQAASNPVTASLVPLFSQTDWQERAPLLGFYTGVTATAGAEVLLGVRGRALPALAFTAAGKGRVATVAAGPLWRWKFVAETGVYDELMARLFDVLTRGEESGRFVLVARKNVFEAGEAPVLFAEVFNEKLQPVTGAPVRVEVARVDAAGTETPLDQRAMRREAPDAPRLTATLDPLPPGRYIVRGKAELPDRVLESRPLDLRISTTSVEFQRTLQDRDALVRIARRSGGEYRDIEGIGDIADRLTLSARTVPVVRESVLRASAPLFLLVLGLVSVEWLLRKRSGMV